MNCKDFFERAVQASLTKYPSPDGNDLIVTVRERAKIMKKQNENRRCYDIVEAAPEQTIHKSGRVFSALAGTAAAVAVIGGSVFGLNYIIGHGGLKEGGGNTGTGAAYRDFSANTEVKDLLDAAKDRFVFGDVAAEVESVEYDGQFVRIKYFVEYIGENAEDSPWWEGLALLLHDSTHNAISHGSMENLAYLEDNREEKMYTCDMEVGFGETADLELFANSPTMFGDNPEVAIASYTLTGIDKSECCYSISDKIDFVSELYGNTEIYSADISAFGVNLRHSKNFAPDKDFSFVIRYKDGSQTELHDYRKTHYGTGSRGEDDFASTFMTIYNGDPIDVNNIASLIINGTEVKLNVYTGEKFFTDVSERAQELHNSKGAEYHVILERNDTIPTGCVIRTEPEFGLLDELPQSYTLYVSSGASVQKTFDITHRADGEPTGIPEIVDFGYAAGRAYVYCSSFSFDELLTELSRNAPDELISAVQPYCDERGELQYDKLCAGLETVEVRGFLDNEAMPGVRYFRLNDKYILGARPEDVSAFVLEDADDGLVFASEQWKRDVHVDYNGIRKTIELLWAVYDGLPDIAVTTHEDPGSGNITLGISVNEDDITALKQYLSDNGADLSLCEFYGLYTF